MTKRKHHESKMFLDVQEHRSWVFPVSSHVHPGSYGKRKTHVTRSKPWAKEDFDVQEMLGGGRFGSVYSALYRRKEDCEQEHHWTNGILQQGSSVALKRTEKQGDRSFALIRNEINIHSHLQHPNITSMIGYFSTPNSIYMVLEYAPKGSIDNEALDLPRPKRLARAQCILAQICHAVGYLHDLSIAHRDIKPENILRFPDNTFKLCDFGWATWYKVGNYHNTLCGTPEFVPPELLHDNDGYRPEFVDPWSLGVLTVELVESKTPFITESLAFDNSTMFDCIRHFKGDPVKDPNADPNYRDFVNLLMTVEPTSRMTAGEALDHKFLSSCRTALRPIQSPTVAQRCELFERTAS